MSNTTPLTEIERAQFEKEAEKRGLQDDKDAAARAAAEAKQLAEQNRLAREAAQREAIEIDNYNQQSVSFRWMAAHPEFFESKNNAKALGAWIKEKGVRDSFGNLWTEENLSAAWEALRDSPEIERGEWKASTPTPREIPSWGFQMDTKKDIDAVEHTLFRKLMLTDPVFKQRVSDILRGGK